MTTQISDAVIRSLLFFGGMSFFLVLELLIPYRPNSVSKARRWVNNLTLTALNTIILTLLFSAAILRTAEYGTRNNAGIVNTVQLPLAPWVKTLLIILFLDFMLYVWHLLNHEVPLLARFHRVHHSDLNMDVSTATRFHMGELVMSAVIKIGLIYFIGADLLALLIFESAVVLCTQFHHSSLKVPRWFERAYWFLFVPPSMHRIHHSIIQKERNTNYGVIFSIWDRIFGTLVQNVDQDKIRIGLFAYPEPRKLDLQHLMVMPFVPPQYNR